jgi:hypothetical protein
MNSHWKLIGTVQCKTKIRKKKYKSSKEANKTLEREEREGNGG